MDDRCCLGNSEAMEIGSAARTPAIPPLAQRWAYSSAESRWMVKLPLAVTMKRNQLRVPVAERCCCHPGLFWIQSDRAWFRDREALHVSLTIPGVPATHSAKRVLHLPHEISVCRRPAPGEPRARRSILLDLVLSTLLHQ